MLYCDQYFANSVPCFRARNAASPSSRSSTAMQQKVRMRNLSNLGNAEAFELAGRLNLHNHDMNSLPKPKENKLLSTKTMSDCQDGHVNSSQSLQYNNLNGVF